MRVLLPNGEVWFMTIEMMEGKKCVVQQKLHPLALTFGMGERPIVKVEFMGEKDPDEEKEKIEKSLQPEKFYDLYEIRTYPRIQL